MSRPCGSFYGTPVSDDSGSFMTPSPRSTDRPPSHHMPGLTPSSRTRNNGHINEKLDKLLSTSEEQKLENVQLRKALEELSDKVSVLQEQVSNDVYTGGTGKLRIPPALSVSCSL